MSEIVIYILYFVLFLLNSFINYNNGKIKGYEEGWKDAEETIEEYDKLLKRAIEIIEEKVV